MLQVTNPEYFTKLIKSGAFDYGHSATVLVCEFNMEFHHSMFYCVLRHYIHSINDIII